MILLALLPLLLAGTPARVTAPGEGAPGCAGCGTGPGTPTTTTTTIPGNAAPPDWTVDAQTVAWWPFDTDVLNHSVSTGYCNPATDGDLLVGVNASDVTFQATPRMQGTGSLNFAAGLGQVKGKEPAPGPRDCLRSAQPAQWTLTGWFRSTTARNFYAQIYNSQSQVGGPENWNYGWITLFYPIASGNVATCVGLNTGASGVECGQGVAVLNNVIPADSNWHFLVSGYNGTSTFLGAGGRAQQVVSSAVVPANFPKNNNDGLGNPFEIPHQSGPYDNMIGNQDAVWWTGRVLTDAQACRVRAVHPTGERGWCLGSTWATCNTDADCGGRASACNTAFPGGGKAGTCVGNLGVVVAGETAPTQCDGVADLPPCDALLGATTSTTTTTSGPSTSSTTTTTLAGTAAGNWVDDMVAVWYLDEASGTRVNAQGNTAYDLSAIVGTAANDPTNKVQGAASFLADNNSKVRRAPANAIAAPSPPFTVGCWARPTDPSGTFDSAEVIGSHDFSVGGYVLDWTDATNRYGFLVCNGTGCTTATSGVATGADNAWRHVVGVFANATTIRAYVSGAPVGADTTVPGGGYVPNTDDWFEIGGVSAGTSFTGQIDECFVDNAALSAAAVCRICSCGLDGALCTCSGAAYVGTGRNASACGSCTLSAVACTATAPP
ncbi:MAG TPA: LamG domain-containing protein [Gaiellales bacterium]|nr:LamG domain-containing protein [Gaiellales bacterium]